MGKHNPRPRELSKTDPNVISRLSLVTAFRSIMITLNFTTEND